MFFSSGLLRYEIRSRYVVKYKIVRNILSLRFEAEVFLNRFVTGWVTISVDEPRSPSENSLIKYVRLWRIHF